MKTASADRPWFFTSPSFCESSCSARSHVIDTNFPLSRIIGPRKRSGLYRPCSADCPRPQSAPRFTGWSGLPSALMARPSRVSMMRPHPAAHSRHVVAKNVETPGTVLSGDAT